jgi:DNA repair protein RadD
MNLRPYQQRSIDQLYQWWVAHPGITETPICVMPTGSGKSVVIAELCRLLFDTWPEEHPRTVVLVPSKELAEQNAAKLCAMLPAHLRVGYYSASLGRKVPDADVIVATIGSIYRDAHLLGNIKVVIVDECHLINPNGTEAGRYRKFLTDLSQLCNFRVVGYTATPFRGNGVWLTDGDAPLFTGIACTVTVQELLDSNHLAPLVRPMDAIATRIDTEGINTSNGDYNIADLSDRVSAYLPAAALEAFTLAQSRKKWIAFCATVANAQAFVDNLLAQGIPTVLVCGDTPALERAQSIADFRAGKLRCLVTVLALATGFDVPDVDCIIWLRPTQSPVLYVQGAGRGMRLAPGKTDCLWLDFSDTTERMGPVDAIRGRKKKAGNPDQGAPFAICPECGDHVTPASALICPSCGATMRDPEAEQPRAASNAAIMAHMVAPKINTYPVDSVTYHLHHKSGAPDSMRVDYMSGLRRVCSEWVCLQHGGFARAKAEAWWARRMPTGKTPQPPNLIASAVALAFIHAKAPTAITVNETGKYPEIIKHHWEPLNDPDRASHHHTSLESATS